VRWGIGPRPAAAISGCDGTAIATVTAGARGAVEVRSLPSLDVAWRRELSGGFAVAPVPDGRRNISIACAGDGSAVVVASGRGAAVVRPAGETPLRGVSWVAGGAGQVVALNLTGTELTTVDIRSSTVERRAVMPAGLLGRRHAIGPDGTIAVLAGPTADASDAATALVLVPPVGDDRAPVVAPLDVTHVELVRWLDIDHVELSFGRDPGRVILTRDGMVGPAEAAPPERVGVDRGIAFTAGATPMTQTSKEVLRRDDGQVVASPALVADVVNLDQAVPVPQDLPLGTSPAGTVEQPVGAVVDDVLPAPADSSSPSGTAVAVVAALVLGVVAVLAVRRRRA